MVICKSCEACLLTGHLTQKNIKMISFQRLFKSLCKFRLAPLFGNVLMANTFFPWEEVL